MKENSATSMTRKVDSLPAANLNSFLMCPLLFLNTKMLFVMYAVIIVTTHDTNCLMTRLKS